MRLFLTGGLARREQRARLTRRLKRQGSGATNGTNGTIKETRRPLHEIGMGSRYQRQRC
ncbi:MAG TPA: hypothetical protein PLK77_12075 [Pyrinomonadaceae bacterium]|nr:hypothetical protein [Pyrinomonadaceae bacterium]